MDAIISLELERMQEGIDRLKLSKSCLSDVFNEDILFFIVSEIEAVISIISNAFLEKDNKKFIISRSLGRLNGVESTVSFISLKRFGGEIPYSIQLLKLEIKLFENSIIRILMNL